MARGDEGRPGGPGGRPPIGGPRPGMLGIFGPPGPPRPGPGPPPPPRPPPIGPPPKPPGTWHVMDKIYVLRETLLGWTLLSPFGLVDRVSSTGTGSKACPSSARGNAEQASRPLPWAKQAAMHGKTAGQEGDGEPAICPPGAFGGRGAPPWRGGPPAPAAMAAIIFCAIAFNPPPPGPGALPGPPPCPGGPLKGGPFLPPPLPPSRPARCAKQRVGKSKHGTRAASVPGTLNVPEASWPCQLPTRSTDKLHAPTQAVPYPGLKHPPPRTRTLTHPHAPLPLEHRTLSSDNRISTEAEAGGGQDAARPPSLSPSLPMTSPLHAQHLSHIHIHRHIKHTDTYAYKTRARNI